MQLYNPLKSISKYITTLVFFSFCFCHHFIIALPLHLSMWGDKVAFYLPSSLLSSLLWALHSCCQETGVALIFLSLVRYAETQANPQTCLFLSLSCSLFALSHALAREHRLTCLSSRLSIKERKVEHFLQSFLWAWRAQKVTVAKHSASSLKKRRRRSLRGLSLLITCDAP